jgi:hypothetical protein
MRNMVYVSCECVGEEEETTIRSLDRVLSPSTGPSIYCPSRTARVTVVFPSFI